MAENKTGKTVKATKPVKTAKTVRTSKAVKAAQPVKTKRATRTTKAVRSVKSVKKKDIKAALPAVAPKSTKVYDIDAYSPQQIAARLDAVAAVKAKDSPAVTFWLGVNAGVFIALGAQFATLVISDSG
ncbi:MAG: hypothetical protein ACC651_05840, partial [Candidatus Scalindua sp.]